MMQQKIVHLPGLDEILHPSASHIFSDRKSPSFHQFQFRFTPVIQCKPILLLLLLFATGDDMAKCLGNHYLLASRMAN